MFDVIFDAGIVEEVAGTFHDLSEDELGTLLAIVYDRRVEDPADVIAAVQEADPGIDARHFVEMANQALAC